MSIIFKDDVVVDNKPITTFVNDISDGNVVDHNTATDAHDNRFNQYLPLSGGAMTGTIKTNKRNAIEFTDTTNALDISAGGSKQGAICRLFGADFQGTGEQGGGTWQLLARVGNNYKTLQGTLSGSLAWNGSGRSVEIKSMAFPSTTSIDLTSSISWNVESKYKTYTCIAPANGWARFSGRKTSSATSYSWIEIDNYTAGLSSVVPYPLNSDTIIDISVIMPCKKGDTIILGVTNETSNYNFRFVYAEGEV